MGFLLSAALLFGSMIGGFRLIDHGVRRHAEKVCAQQTGAPCSCGYVVPAPNHGHYVCDVKGTPASHWRELQREADEAYDRWLHSEPK